MQRQWMPCSMTLVYHLRDKRFLCETLLGGKWKMHLRLPTAPGAS
ncbi:hypothetical protein NOVOSPHI9U_650012 [Novosphingobium sp. 9U]|nr:hypothetical protein NOVOSPHI9U_650012 [Novosphingobium sp. 9U]